MTAVSDGVLHGAGLDLQSVPETLAAAGGQEPVTREASRDALFKRGRRGCFGWLRAFFGDLPGNTFCLQSMPKTPAASGVGQLGHDEDRSCRLAAVTRDRTQEPQDKTRRRAKKCRWDRTREPQDKTRWRAKIPDTPVVTGPLLGPPDRVDVPQRAMAGQHLSGGHP